MCPLFLITASGCLSLLYVRVINRKSDSWGKGMNHGKCSRNLQCWRAMHLQWCPHVIKSSKVIIGLCCHVAALEIDIFNSTSPVLQFSPCTWLLIRQFCQFVCVCVCFCACARSNGALELRNGFELPSAALMHANLPLASRENNFSRSTNKVQTPPPRPQSVDSKGQFKWNVHEKAQQSVGVSCRSSAESQLSRTSSKT